MFSPPMFLANEVEDDDSGAQSLSSLSSSINDVPVPHQNHNPSPTSRPQSKHNKLSAALSKVCSPNITTGNLEN